MAEILNLTTPMTGPTVTTYRVAKLHLDWLPEPRIEIRLKGSDGSFKLYTYDDESTPTATSLITTLNTANLSVKSLHKRVLERIELDFAELDGTISGSPD